MLSIDEMIELHKMKARASKHFNSRTRVSYTAEEHEQLAEWLEELKCYKNDNDFSDYADRLHKIAFNSGYNKALDDLLGGMNQITYNYQNADELFEKICDLAEQLKAGEENDNLRR